MADRETDEGTRMRENMIRLVNIQTSLNTVQSLMVNKDDLANTLSDVFNTILDYRGLVVQNLAENKHMQVAGLVEEFQRILSKSSQNQIKTTPL